MSGRRSQEELLRAGEDFMTSVCEERLFATGAQLAVSVDGRATSSVAVGYQLGDTELRPDHHFNVWCASKPVPAMVLLALLEGHGLMVEDDVSRVLGDPEGGGARLSIADLLSHRSGLSIPHVVSANLMPMSEAVALARERRRGPERAYFSEFGASVVVSDLIERLASMSPLEALQSAVAQWDLSSHMSFEISEAHLDDPFDRLGFFLTLEGGRELPMLHDALPSIARERRDILGCYATAHGLCGFYSLVGRVLAGESVPGFASPSFLREALRHRRGRSYDHELRKECDFAAGFMIGLSDHGYGHGPSPAAIGHTGMMGSPFGWFDPESGIACGVIVNGFSLSPDDYIGWRPHLVSAMAG